MPKYSTGSGGGGGDADSCELCGRSSPKLRRANVAGANLLVCPDCAPHDDSKHEGTGGSSSSDTSDSEPSRKKRAAQRQAKMYDQAKGDSKHWEREGTNYEKDRLPYLVSDYGDVVATARQDAGLTVEELAAELDADESDIDAVEQGRATRAGVGGSLVRAIEEKLDVTLVDE
ncbi:multiprotein-bridging factor 1 family protein [Halogeometricum borinquense]|uniref:Transcriptional regulator, XRE family n=2 Tax=Halogeometricum borinquense TaxID=60847 RepID=E4NR35_HALBP|nr:multiprotein-bridging factor 1 family protein [Halogeometricum borinquense]ADQ66771.1 transcriptional regulator, XRE family [Halogeometricum borinquense DSM 11551]ELY30279.1 XRE family transcriptional regulator [Halogeometricum borinquense DSM 11551]QIB74909.1 multiprotein-bridging factor 1 family protein [Halogeometricum borinquense]QIQ76091.1 multiprotein-bridging factor 1 family protein [Halogeometricum borinquense]RYJ14257.1 multiprotein-bridging factor 1 family protein [Halogeometricum